MRTFLDAPTTELGAAEVSVQCSDPTHEIKVVRLSSGDGRWCLEAGIESTKWVIRSVEAGVVGSSLTNGASDEPMSAACETNHLLGGSPVAFRFTVRLVNNTISLYVNGSTTATLSHALTDAEIEAFGQNRHWGLASDVTGARAVNVQQCTLEADITPRLDGLVGVCGGNLYAVLDETGPRLIAAGRFNTTGPVSLAAYQQHVYGVDGTHAVDLNFTTLTASDWGDDTGDGVLPGAVETAPSSGVYVPGTTRMTHVMVSGDRVKLEGDPQDPQNRFESAIGNASDWNTATNGFSGRATAFNAELSGRIGEPIVTSIELDRNTDLILCTNSVWRKVGDFALGNPVLERIESADGCSGMNAIVPVSSGVAMYHSPSGVCIAGAGGIARNISKQELTEGITIAAEDIGDYAVQMLRDPVRHLVWIFLTPVSSPDSGFSIHFAYCTRTAEKGGFGWFAQTFPAAIGPTACCIWKGIPVLGTRDGYLITPDDAEKTDLDDAIDCNVPFGGTAGMGCCIKQNDAALDTMIHALAFEGSVETQNTEATDAVTFNVYGGNTTQMACAGTQRWLLMTGTAPLYNRPVRRRLRAPAIVVEASNSNDPERSIRLEAVHVEQVPCRRATRSVRAAVDSIGVPTRSPTGDLSFPDAATPQTPSEGPGPGTNPPSPPPGGGGEIGFGIIFQSPFDLAEQAIELEYIAGFTQPFNGGGGPGGGGGGGGGTGPIDTGPGPGTPPNPSDNPGVLPW